MPISAAPLGPLTRRRLLALGGGVGAAVLLGACGDEAEQARPGGTSDGGAGRDGTASSDGFVVLARFPNSRAIVPGPARLAVSLAAADGTLLTDGPATLTGSVRDERGAVVAEIATPRRGATLGVPYWSVTADLPAPGLYEIALDGAAGDPLPMLVFDPAEATVPVPGARLPAFDTPTVDDPRGVDPICTRLDGACPFHDVSLADALAAGRPVVYLVGTPAHCRTATCGPGLEFLMAVAPELADRASFVHAEVYADPAGTEVAPAVTALGLDYEPTIFVTDASGTVVQRIDIVWDEAELRELLAAALS